MMDGAGDEDAISHYYCANLYVIAYVRLTLIQ